MPVLVKSQYIFVSVDDADHDSLGQFKITLPILQTGEKVFNRLYIKKAIIPYNWQRVTATTKTLTINGTPYELTEGNPNILDLIKNINEIQSLIVATFNRITSKIEWANQTGGNITLSSDAYEMLGLEQGVTYTWGIQETLISPRVIDVRPTPIVEIRVDLATAGLEIFDEGKISNTNILAAIGMNVPVYGHKVWIDDQAMYYADITNENRDITIIMTDTNGNPIVPQTAPYFVIGIDTLINHQGELVDLQKESLKLQRYNLILSHGEETPAQK